MDNKKVKSILQDALEEQVPASQIDLLPAVQSRLIAGKTSNLQQGENMSKIRTKRLVLSAVIVMAVLVLALMTPRGQALAQRIFLFFTVTQEKSFPIPTEQVFSLPATKTPVPTYILPLEPVEPAAKPTQAPQPDPSCSSPESQSGYSCQIEAVEAQAGFDAKELPNDPKGLKFSQAQFNPQTKEIDMEFVSEGGALYLNQGLGEFPSSSKWGEVPANEIKQVSVHGQYAELVSGMFVIYPNATAATWEPSGQLRLHWQEGDRWFSLEKMGDPYPIEWMDESQIIRLAESLVDERPWNEAAQVDPENLTSVESAEQLAGFDVPAPTLLPKGYELKRLIWADDTMRLLYGPKNSTDVSLLIFMGQLTNQKAERCSDCPPGTVEDVQIGLWQGWYWRGIFNMGEGTNVQPTPTPVWEADARAWHLVWNTDTLWFSMFYTASSDYGGEMNRETMIKIAESLKVSQ